MFLAVALDPHLQLFGECVDHRHTHPVQTAGYLVAVLVEFAAGVQHRHGHLEPRHFLGRVNVNRNTTPVVRDGNRVVVVNGDGHRVAVTGQCLVDGVVDDFVHEVMETTG